MIPLLLLLVGAGPPAAGELVTATMLPDGGRFTVGTRHDLRVTITARRPLAPGTELRLVSPAAGGWSRPSLDPTKEESPGGFIAVGARLEAPEDRGARLELRCEKWSDRGPPYTTQDNQLAAVVTIADGGLQPGDRVIIELPNCRVGARAPHPDPRRNVAGYRLQVRPAGGEAFVEVEGLPRFGLDPGAPQAVHLRAPSLVVAGEPFGVSLAALDGWEGNPTPGFVGELTLTSTDGAARLPERVSLAADQRGLTTVDGLVLATPGRHVLTVRADRALPLTDTATARIEVLAEPPALRLLWAELHNHGALSYDARNWGGCTMRPADQFWFGRAVMNLDVCAVTDHSMHSSQNRQQNMTEPEYQEIQRAAAAAYRPGSYVAFSAVESRDARGDTNVYYLRDDEPFYMRDRLLTVEQLWEFYRRSEIVTIPHLHPSVRRPERFDAIDPTKERAVEIHSNHGRYEFHENEPLKPAKGMVEGNNVQAILARGHRLGIVAASDDHSGRPGLRDLTGVWAPERTREAVFAAIQARHTFGTTGPRTNLMFRLGDALMGDEVRLPADQPRRLSARVDATSEIERIEVIRNGLVIYSVDPDGQTADLDYADLQPLAEATLGTERGYPPTAYYYLRVTQACERQGPGRLPVDMAWSSPIFVSAL